MISCDFFNGPKARKQGFLIFFPQKNKKQTNIINLSFRNLRKTNEKQKKKKNLHSVQLTMKITNNQN